MTNEAPDKNCYTLPNGDCIGVDCMHNRRDKSPIIGSSPADWPPPNGAYHWEWCKRVNTRGMNAKCDCGGPEAKARAERDISSDPVPAREHQAGVCGARGVTTGSYAPCCHLPAGHAGMHNSGGIVPQTWFEPRDISSDPDEALTYIDDEYLRRDISSVTGSAADELLSSLAATGDYLNTTLLDRKDIEKTIAAIQREAVDAFIRNELPGLLTRAMPDAHEDVPPEIAAKIAELRKA